jgi:hypothetical protein
MDTRSDFLLGEWSPCALFAARLVFQFGALCPYGPSTVAKVSVSCENKATGVQKWVVHNFEMVAIRKGFLHLFAGNLSAASTCGSQPHA